MDRLVKAEEQELCLPFGRGSCSGGQRCCATFKLTSLMHTMSVAVSLTTTNPSLFTFSRQPFSIIPPLSTSSFTLIFSPHHDHDHHQSPPLSSPLDAVLVRSSMLPTGKAHQDDLRRLFSKPGPHVFRDATLPISFVGPHVVESLILAPPKSHLLELAFLLSKAISWCDQAQLDSLLCLSATHGNAYVASALIEAGADVNVGHMSSWLDTDHSDQLEEAGGWVAQQSTSSSTAMSLAVKSGNIGVVRVLIESGYELRPSVDHDRFLLHHAAAMNRLDLLEILCRGYYSHDMDILNSATDSRGRTPLHIAALHGHLEAVGFLVSQAGTDPDVADCEGWTALHYAARGDHTEAVGTLLDHSISAKYALTKEGKTALDLAARDEEEEEDQYSHHHIHIMYDRLGLGDKLHIAARSDDVEGIKKCLGKAGAKVNSRDQNGWTALHRAAFKGGMESVKALISNGAQVDAVNDIGYTPLHLAVEAGHIQVALCLLQLQPQPPGHEATAKPPTNIILKSLRSAGLDLDCFKNHPSDLVPPNPYYQEKGIASSLS